MSSDSYFPSCFMLANVSVTQCLESVILGKLIQQTRSIKANLLARFPHSVSLCPLFVSTFISGEYSEAIQTTNVIVRKQKWLDGVSILSSRF